MLGVGRVRKDPEKPAVPGNGFVSEYGALPATVRRGEVVLDAHVVYAMRVPVARHRAARR